MKYDIKYAGLKPLEVRDNYLWSHTVGKCWCCGAPTHCIEINYEAYICSEECEWEIDKEINERCKEIPDDGTDEYF